MSRRNSNIILVGIIAAVALGLGFATWNPKGAVEVKFLGDFFLTSLKMIVVPLVVASVIVGITALGDIRRLGRVGVRTLAFYAATTAISVAIGMVLVLAIKPGAGVEKLDDAVTTTRLESKKIGEKSERGWRDIVLSFVSDNIIGSLANMQMLPIIVFALFFGGILTTLGEEGEPVIAVVRGINAAIMKMVSLIMWMAPIGIFGLVASKFGAADGQIADELSRIGKYVLTVLLGLGIHAIIVLPLLCAWLARRNPLRYVAAMFPALLTAWSTASSSATLPLTVECAETRGNVRPKAAGFVLPLGATINMDGTALYEGVAAIFIAQLFGIDLTMGQLFIIFITATLAAIGAAGIPEAGLFTMVIVLKAVGLPLEGIAMLLVVDWFLDRFRTSVNVWGDSVGAAFIDHSLGDELDRVELPDGAGT